VGGGQKGRFVEFVGFAESETDVMCVTTQVTAIYLLAAVIR
jgi:hypothetical protein